VNRDAENNKIIVVTTIIVIISPSESMAISGISTARRTAVPIAVNSTEITNIAPETNAIIGLVIHIDYYP
jgi:hypothetical protein